jgi:membrane protein implicated in regulation of membrane protease activity
MVVFRVSRGTRGPGPYPNLRIALFCLGAAIAGVGIASHIDWLIYVALGVLFIALALRFFDRGSTPSSSDGLTKEDSQEQS